jgi:hypothetical protein
MGHLIEKLGKNSHSWLNHQPCPASRSFSQAKMTASGLIASRHGGFNAFDGWHSCQKAWRHGEQGNEA